MGWGEGRWFRLNIPAVVFCIGWCTLFIAFCTDCLDEKLELREERGVRIVDIRSVYVVVLRYPVIVVASAGVLCYVLVSWRRPRPPMLHWHGLVLMVMVLLAWLVIRHPCYPATPEDYVEARWNAVTIYILGGVKSILLVTLMIVKIDALGPPLSCFVNIRLWGRILNYSQSFYYFFQAPLVPWWALSMWDRGFTRAEINFARTNLFTEEQREVDLEPADEVVVPLSMYSLLAGLAWLALVRLAFVLVATRLIWDTMRRLIERKAEPEQLWKVRIVLWQHVSGMWLILLSASAASLALIWQTVRMPIILGWEEPEQPPFTSLTFLLDGAGDILGALLLSGILALLFKDQPDGGDISGHIRGILHSAVLTSRSESVFEGRVIETPLSQCMVSFPGKCQKEWNELTWFCERRELSSACVFLPKEDPHQRFGRHDLNPNTPDQCWCHSMYGAQKPWGCAWFTAWMANVEMAVHMNLDLVVVFFEKQTNQGIVEWENLKSADLWDGVGLGGSQKVEVAWLNLKGYRYIAEDITVTKQRFDRQRHTPRTGTPTPNGGSSSIWTPNNTPSASNLWRSISWPKLWTK